MRYRAYGYLSAARRTRVQQSIRGVAEHFQAITQRNIDAACGICPKCGGKLPREGGCSDCGYECD